MTSAGDLINGALRLIGELAEDESPSAGASADALMAFDQLVDSWNTERLSVYATTDTQYTWPAGSSSRTIGPTGNIVTTTRPVAIDQSTYFVGSNSLSYSPEFINQDQYNAIALKTVTSTYPQVIWVNNTFPDITLTVYPVPDASSAWHIIHRTILTDPAALTTEISLPPGYLRAFRFNLACEISAEFGVEAPPTVKRIADVSKRNLKRINNPGDLMAMPYALAGNVGRFNIFSGGFS